MQLVAKTKVLRLYRPTELIRSGEEKATAATTNKSLVWQAMPENETLNANYCRGTGVPRSDPSPHRLALQREKERGGGQGLLT